MKERSVQVSQLTLPPKSQTAIFVCLFPRLLPKNSPSAVTNTCSQQSDLTETAKVFVKGKQTFQDTVFRFSRQ